MDNLNIYKRKQKNKTRVLLTNNQIKLLRIMKKLNIDFTKFDIKMLPLDIVNLTEEQRKEELKKKKLKQPFYVLEEVTNSSFFSREKKKKMIIKRYLVLHDNVEFDFKTKKVYLIDSTQLFDPEEEAKKEEEEKLKEEKSILEENEVIVDDTSLDNIEYNYNKKDELFKKEFFEKFNKNIDYSLIRYRNYRSLGNKSFFEVFFMEKNYDKLYNFIEIKNKKIYIENNEESIFELYTKLNKFYVMKCYFFDKNGKLFIYFFFKNYYITLDNLKKYNNLTSHEKNVILNIKKEEFDIIDLPKSDFNRLRSKMKNNFSINFSLLTGNFSKFNIIGKTNINIDINTWINDNLFFRNNTIFFFPTSEFITKSSIENENIIEQNNCKFFIEKKNNFNLLEEDIVVKYNKININSFIKKTKMIYLLEKLKDNFLNKFFFYGLSLSINDYLFYKNKFKGFIYFFYTNFIAFTFTFIFILLFSISLTNFFNYIFFNYILQNEILYLFYYSLLIKFNIILCIYLILNFVSFIIKNLKFIVIEKLPFVYIKKLFLNISLRNILNALIYFFFKEQFYFITDVLKNNLLYLNRFLHAGYFVWIVRLVSLLSGWYIYYFYIKFGYIFLLLILNYLKNIYRFIFFFFFSPFFNNIVFNKNLDILDILDTLDIKNEDYIYILYIYFKYNIFSDLLNILNDILNHLNALYYKNIYFGINININIKPKLNSILPLWLKDITFVFLNFFKERSKINNDVVNKKEKENKLSRLEIFNERVKRLDVTNIRTFFSKDWIILFPAVEEVWNDYVTFYNTNFFFIWLRKKFSQIKKIYNYYMNMLKFTFLKRNMFYRLFGLSVPVFFYYLHYQIVRYYAIIIFFIKEQRKVFFKNLKIIPKYQKYYIKKLLLVLQYYIKKLFINLQYYLNKDKKIIFFWLFLIVFLLLFFFLLFITNNIELYFNCYW